MNLLALSKLATRGEKLPDSSVSVTSRQGGFGAGDEGIVLIDARRHWVDESRTRNVPVCSPGAYDEADSGYCGKGGDRQQVL
jgi:hypothetical protein